MSRTTNTAFSFLFCSDPFDITKVDPDYQEEWDAVATLTAKAFLFDFDALVAEGSVVRATRGIPKAVAQQRLVYRGWMLTPEQYVLLFEQLCGLGYTLINDPVTYKTCHYLPETLEFIRDHTPLTLFEPKGSNPDILIDRAAFTFGRTPVIIKDYVKSEKHHWETACYVPDASDSAFLRQSIQNLIELRGASLNGGIVIREFVALKHLTLHSKSGMPLTEEYRLFFLDNRLVAVFPYWEEGEYTDELPDFSTFTERAETIPSAFFTMDIARTTSGELLIIELGDGQVSGLPDSSLALPFYKMLLN